MHDADDETETPDEKAIWERIQERSGAERADALDILADRFIEAATALEAAAELYAAEDRHIQAGKCLHNTAMALGIDGRPVEALAAHERAVAAVFEAAGANQWAAVARIDLASALLAAGEGGDRAVRCCDAPKHRCVAPG